ncbi:hypothetical protein GCM10011375_26870 [Hymenobacter qilianensis]|uniref:Uncharacterized protein n=2 Tax=Hymenobacter qilianensis TaxID=1385715 RepID=A0ACB5PTG6_9BACT|nr:hypothetical protein [Hymenobacter qilianensis]QNP52759.1 hypothetical protein H9L05_03150 [Hymenobacter qilianensis]GGF70403.1 hypothetical protein GCM10011375_26870 [Hymenobacter qilianensis]
MGELRSAAEAVRQNLNFSSFDGVAVSKLAEFIDRERASIKQEALTGAVNALGCFLGECIIRSFGGHWHRDASGLVGIQIAGCTFINPFSYVERQLEQGAAECVMVLFQSVPTRLAAAAVPRRRTWIPVPLPPRRTTSP